MHHIQIYKYRHMGLYADALSHICMHLVQRCALLGYVCCH